MVAVFMASVWTVVVRDATLSVLPYADILVITNAADAAAYVGGVVGAALAYLRLRDLSVETGLPRPSAAGAAAVLVPLAVVAGALLAESVLGVKTELFDGVRYAPVVPLWYIVAESATAATWFAAGYALLVCGVIYETVHHHVASSDRDAFVLTVGLVVIVRFLPVSVEVLTQLSAGSLSSIVPTHLALNVFGIVAAFCAAFTIGVVYRAIDAGDVAGVVSPWYVPAFAVTGTVLFLLAVDPHTPFEELYYVGVLAAAVAGYARTASIWTAITVVFLFELAVSVVPAL
jgi:hypothetical protein